MLCKYSDSLGVPGKGVHEHFMGIAYMDVIFTCIAAEIISYTTGWNFFLVLFALLITGIFVHRLFCVRTTVDRWLFP